MNRSEVVSVRLGEEEKEDLGVVAWDRGVSASDLVRTAMNEFTSSYAEEHGGMDHLLSQYRVEQVRLAESEIEESQQRLAIIRERLQGHFS